MVNRPGLDPAPVRPAILPPRLAVAFRPKLPDLANEIIDEIRAAIPEYAQAVDGAYEEALRIGVHQALETFIDRIADPDTPSDDMAEVCRQLGRYEAYEGRTLDSLQAAYRIGAQVAWRRAKDEGKRLRVSSDVVSELADSVFSYMDELAALSLEGYQEAKVKADEGSRERARRLLRCILEQPPTSPAALDGLAAQAQWDLPAEVTLVALRPRGRSAASEPRTLVDASQLADDLLSDLACPQPHVLVPGPVNKARERMLKKALKGVQAAIGPTVRLPDAANSLRWARQTLSLAESGVIEGKPMIRCEEHLQTLWLMADLPLAELIVQRELEVLKAIPESQGDKLTETLFLWLTAGWTAVRLGRELGVHPQTIRYRMQQFKDLLGERLEHPSRRFCLVLALRLKQIRQHLPD